MTSRHLHLKDALDLLASLQSAHDKLADLPKTLAGSPAVANPGVRDALATNATLSSGALRGMMLELLHLLAIQPYEDAGPYVIGQIILEPNKTVFTSGAAEFETRQEAVDTIATFNIPHTLSSRRCFPMPAAFVPYISKRLAQP